MPTNETPEQWRLFIAIQIPEPVKDRIEQAQAVLREACGKAPVRWTRRDQFHLTLKFMGNVAAAHTPDLQSALRAAVAAFPPLRLRARGIGFFPEALVPRVVWVGVENGDRLVELQGAVEKAVTPYTAEPAEKRFSGHVTLGRIRSMRRVEADVLAQAAERTGRAEFGQWTAGHIEIIRSELSSQGARYFSVASLPLAG